MCPSGQPKSTYSLRRSSMKIGIIGVGAVGGVIAQRLAENGHEVRVANSRGAETVSDFANKIGAAATDAKGAVDGADVVVLSIPFSAIQKLPEGLFDNLSSSATVIDTSNYYPNVRDPSIQEIDAGKAESVWVSEQIGRPVIKAFNILFSETLVQAAMPEGAVGRLAIPVAGDDPEQKKIAMRMVNEVGFDPFDAGALVDSWRQQPGSPCYCCDFDADRLRAALAAATQGVPAKNRDYFLAHLGVFLGGVPTRERMVGVQRHINNPTWPVVS
ncbi:NADPH-dependent F420 reductase [Ralstonia pseudosolanacearum]|uniref:NADPH-dependent F420 reductase n=1 Tax=Ralstonia solanacearum species complex TaxID=3116862 RepID=UPI0024104AF7|nr:NAD(P)-binding domain-containing protein [Ralstonia pseudosolanacearum]